MTDDHDREFSVADLSVQIFTVPSLVSTERLENALVFHLSFRIREVRLVCPWIGDTSLGGSQMSDRANLQNIPLNIEVIMEDSPFEFSAYFPIRYPSGSDW